MNSKMFGVPSLALKDKDSAGSSIRSVRFIFDRELATADAGAVEVRDFAEEARFTALNNGDAVTVDIPLTVLTHVASRLLGRKVFLPLEFQQRVTKNAFIGLSDFFYLLHSIRMETINHHVRPQKSIQILFYHIVCLIFMKWPHNHSAELEVPEYLRPPLALRIGLDYILSCDGLVGRTEDVARVANVSLRTLEGLFALWLKMGVGRYCKRVRLNLAYVRREQTGEDLHTLAEEYQFTNITRFKRDLESFDATMATRIMPQQFYSGLVPYLAADCGAEPPRLCRRPQFVRSRVYDKQDDEQVFS